MRVDVKVNRLGIFWELVPFKQLDGAVTAFFFFSDRYACGH